VHDLDDDSRAPAPGDGLKPALTFDIANLRFIVARFPNDCRSALAVAN